MKINETDKQTQPIVSFSEKQYGTMNVNSSGDKNKIQMHNKNTLHAIKRRRAQSK